MSRPQDVAADFAMTSFEARRDSAGSPVVAATVHNSGGRAVGLSGELALTNGPGGLSAGPFAVALRTTLGIGPVLVSLDRAVPAGPWDAHLVLRSGDTQREATAKITFPVAAAKSSGPVATHALSGGGGPVVPVIIGLAVLLILGLSFWGLRRTRRRAPTTTGQEPPESTSRRAA